MPEDNQVNVVVTLTRKDYESALKALAKKKRNWILSAVFYVSTAYLAWMLVSLARKSDWPFLMGVVDVVAFGLLILSLLAFGKAMRWFSARSFVKKNPHRLGPAKHSAGPEGTAYDGEHGEGKATWSAYQRILETKDLFLLYTQSNLAQIVPKRCFESPTHVEAYRQVLKAYYNGKLELLG